MLWMEGLQLKIGHGVLARSIYIYGDDDDDDDDNGIPGHDDSDDEERRTVHGGSSGRAVVEVGGTAAEEGVSCPILPLSLFKQCQNGCFRLSSPCVQ